MMRFACGMDGMTTTKQHAGANPITPMGPYPIENQILPHANGQEKQYHRKQEAHSAKLRGVQFRRGVAA